MEIARSTPGGPPSVPHGRGLDRRGPAAVAYVEADEVGFEAVPLAVRRELEARRLIDGEPLAASCDRPRVVRRADASYEQRGSAWWGRAGRAVVLDLRREMAPRGGTRFAPTGAWRVTGTLHHLGSVGEPELSTWAFEGGGVGGARSGAPVMSDDPLDLLPPDVVAPVRGGQSDAWRDIAPHEVCEWVEALRVTRDEAYLLRATRVADSVERVSGATWTIATLMAPITRSESFSFPTS